MSKFLLIAAPIAFAASVAAPAQTPNAAPAANQTPPTRAELVTKLDEGFNRVDTNHDGFLSREEVGAEGAKALAQAQEAVNEKAQEEFTKLDTDKNGQLSLAEFRAAARVSAKSTPDQAIQRLDANKDGRVSANEFKNPTLAAYDKVDLNKDGKVTQDEVNKAKVSR